MKIILLMLVLLFAASVYTQEGYLTVDEFGRTPCDELRARIDNFWIQLGKHPPSDQAIILIQGTTFETERVRKSIEQGILSREYSIHRFKFFRRIGSPVVTGFLIVHGGTDFARDEYKEWRADEWPVKRSSLSKPFVFGSYYDDDPCPTFSRRNYAELLLANSNLRGHLVIHPQSRRFRNAIAVEWLKEFNNEFHVPSNRFRIFYAKPSKWSFVEFWIVPTKTWRHDSTLINMK